MVPCLRQPLQVQAEIPIFYAWILQGYILAWWVPKFQRPFEESLTESWTHGYKFMTCKPCPDFLPKPAGDIWSTKTFGHIPTFEQTKIPPCWWPEIPVLWWLSKKKHRACLVGAIEFGEGKTTPDLSNRPFSFHKMAIWWWLDSDKSNLMVMFLWSSNFMVICLLNEIVIIYILYYWY